MIIPTEITNFERTDAELEAFLLFGVCVAGKRSKDIAPKINAFCESLVGPDDEPYSPCEGIRELIRNDMLEETLREFKLGCYKDLIRAFWEVTFLDLRTCTVEDLEACHGIGYKTSAFFLTHSREGMEIPVLDTHILKWLRSHGVDAPKQTPTNRKRYKELCDKFIELGQKHFPDLSLAELDLSIWKEYSDRAAGVVVD